jgi:hypothetical protein
MRRGRYAVPCHVDFAADVRSDTFLKSLDDTSQ